MPLNTNAGTFYTGEKLVAIASRIYEEALPPLNADRLIPPTGSESLGAEQIEREVYQHTGTAEFIGAFGDDLPRANVSVIRDLYRVGMIGCSYGYSLKDERNSQFARRDVAERRGIAGRRAMEEKRNSIFFAGDVGKQIYGLSTFPIIPRILLSLADFAPGADPDDTLAALYSVGNLVYELSNFTENPTHLLLDPETYTYISNTRASVLTGESILTTYEKNARRAQQVVEVREFSRLSPTGGRMIMAVTLGNDRAEHIVPDPLTILAPEPRNLETVINMVAETAGFITEYPLAHARGILS